MSGLLHRLGASGLSIFWKKTGWNTANMVDCLLSYLWSAILLSLFSLFWKTVLLHSIFCVDCLYKMCKSSQGCIISNHLATAKTPKKEGGLIHVGSTFSAAEKKLKSSNLGFSMMRSMTLCWGVYAHCFSVRTEAATMLLFYFIVFLVPGIELRTSHLPGWLLCHRTKYPALEIMLCNLAFQTLSLWIVHSQYFVETSALWPGENSKRGKAAQVT